MAPAVASTRAALAAPTLLTALVLLVVGYLRRDRSLEEPLKKGELRVYIDPDYPPMSFPKGDGVEGFDPGLASKIAQRLDPARPLRVTWVMFPWKWHEIVERLERKEFDVAISGIMITDDREDQVDFLEYLTPGHYFVSKKGASFQSEKDLAGKVVAVPVDTGTEWLVNRLKERRGIAIRKIIPLNGNELPFKSVHDGEANVTLAHGPVANYFAKKYGLQVSQEPLGFLKANRVGIAFRKQDAKLKARVKEVLEELEAKGILDDLRQLWLAKPKP